MKENNGVIMKIEHTDIVLRDMVESDIADYVRWFTAETEWAMFDTPWETLESDAETEHTAWREYYETVKNLNNSVLRRKFEIEWKGRHIGWVSSYQIDENCKSVGKMKNGQTVYRAIGIDICETDCWGKGIGTHSLNAFINYYFENDIDEIYLQTWSGNIRMIRCAERLGFTECNRWVGGCAFDGQQFDWLTFRLQKAI